MSQASNLLDAQSPLAERLPGFIPRSEQQRMAKQVELTLADGGVALIEAGTGIGKTLAYLIPVFLSGQKVVISTASKHLQAQLFNRDIPLVRQALGAELSTLPKVALLRGRQNYLCLHYLEQLELNQDALALDVRDQFQTVKKWSMSTQSGDLSELDSLGEDAVIRSYVTCDNDRCLGKDCHFIERCHVSLARRRAISADLVVVNHHVLLADLSLKRDKLGELLPAFEFMVLDEAHHVPEIARHFFSAHVGTRRLNHVSEQCCDVFSEHPEHAWLNEYGRKLADQAQMLTACLRQTSKTLVGSLAAFASNTQYMGIRDALTLTLEALESRLIKLIEHSESCEALYDLVVDLRQDCSDVFSHNLEGFVHWYECFEKTVILHASPVVLNERMQALFKQPKLAGCVLTSATLSADGCFEHFTHELGLSECSTSHYDSPFDYQKQALMYLPRYLPGVNEPTHTEQFMHRLLPVLQASRGRALLLFTSFKAMLLAHDVLEEHLTYPLLIQGQMSKTSLLKTFVQTEHAVLLATGSFWEGIDVPGDALSCLAIDRLPFASLSCPILQARIQQEKAQGRQPFLQYQLPKAVVAFKQGVGRLIRTLQCRGVIVVGDHRLLARSYGASFLNSLPNIPRTREFSDVASFFEVHEERVVETEGENL